MKSPRAKECTQEPLSSPSDSSLNENENEKRRRVRYCLRPLLPASPIRTTFIKTMRILTVSISFSRDGKRKRRCQCMKAREGQFAEDLFENAKISCNSAVALEGTSENRPEVRELALCVNAL